MEKTLPASATGSICDYRDIIKFSLSCKKKIMALDYGKRRVGVALSDSKLKTALPLKVLKNDKFSLIIEEIKSLIEEYSVCSIVIGLPLLLDGRFSAMTRACRSFGYNLARTLEIRVCFMDERFSTIGSIKMLRQQGIESRHISKLIDSASAVWILQTLLDKGRKLVENPLGDELK